MPYIRATTVSTGTVVIGNMASMALRARKEHLSHGMVRLGVMAMNLFKQTHKSALQHKPAPESMAQAACPAKAFVTFSAAIS